MRDVNCISKGLIHTTTITGNVGDNGIFQQYWRYKADLANILNRKLLGCYI